MNDPSSDTFAVALVSMPWAIFNRPSIQLASLQSFTEQQSSYTVDTFHPYLAVAARLGVELYHEIARSGWAGEALFSALLYPEKFDDTKKLFLDEISPSTRKDVDFESLTTTTENCCNNWLSSRDLSQYGLLGFSICFSQLLPSLFMAKLVKAKYPSLPIVFGGSSCSGEPGRSLLDQFPQIDYVIDGEGEQRLLALCDNMYNKESREICGLHSRHRRQATAQPIGPLKMDALPIPDYSSYFREVGKIFPNSPFIPLLPVEFSRGCWWNKCTFCNLNIQWPAYRHKSGKRMLDEVTSLSKTYQSLNFTFTDNALPPKEADFFFSKIASAPVDLNFFAEIRGTSAPQRLKQYRKGGLATVQVGIEALSTSLLKKMKKGCTVMDNIAMMKLCTEQGISLEGNIIVDFPTTTTTEITETLNNLKYILPFVPLETATFFLGYGSPIFSNAKDYSIRSITPHTKTKFLFPKSCHNSMTSLIMGYRGDKILQKKMWQPVRKAIADWKKFHENRTNTQIPALSYRDGESFIIIRQEIPAAATLHHRLKGISRKIYLSAHVPIKIDVILEQFPQVSQQAVETFINEMCAKRLMFKEKNTLLSLAVRQH
jgi:ribosomal peptide maturation radical SAM protein 1